MSAVRSKPRASSALPNTSDTLPDHVEVRVPIPGPKAAPIIADDTRLMMTGTKTSPVAAASARGVWITDVDGNGSSISRAEWVS